MADTPHPRLAPSPASNPAPSPASSSKPKPAPKPSPSSALLWLQGVTLLWMLIELGVSAWAAASAHSPVLFAFGADSLVEVLSASVVLLQFSPRLTLSELQANRAAGTLLFLLAGVVTALAVASLALHLHPQASPAGLAITLAALVAMPVLAALKRKEAHRTGNHALAADAVQSATCAYLALLAIAGLATNAFFHIPWIDSVAALAAVPLLIREGRSARQGNPCACC